MEDYRLRSLPFLALPNFMLHDFMEVPFHRRREVRGTGWLDNYRKATKKKRPNKLQRKKLRKISQSSRRRNARRCNQAA